MIDIGRENQCPKIEEFQEYATDNPLWGMPYALPGLSREELNPLTDWLDAGAPMPIKTALPSQYQSQVDEWEQFFNRDTLKGKLVNRYIYEHLFLAHIYFDKLPSTHFFELIRSYTPPGSPIKIIASRRPFDSPGTETFFYRLREVESTIIAKTHLPYALGEERRERWEQWFYKSHYQVTTLPSYAADIASNPFITFKQLPQAARYRFMLEEAQFTIMGFIKGPVCRGQVALNVIQDHFWVYFKDPDDAAEAGLEALVTAQSRNLILPAEAGSPLLPIRPWIKYSRKHTQYLSARYDFAQNIIDQGKLKLNTDIIWDGDGHNNNAALTIFRHFDNATVAKGLLGGQPKTAWIIGYPILERIHYLLVAGFDVYGSLSHQLLTRLYMDFLRMESEFNFLALLPNETRKSEWKDWYQGANSGIQAYIDDSSQHFYHPTDINYSEEAPKAQLYKLLGNKLSEVLDTRHSLEHKSVPALHRTYLKQLSKLKGTAASLLAQITILSIEDHTGQIHLYTILHNNAHTNITSLLNEAGERIPEQDNLSVMRGLVGNHPGAFWHTTDTEISSLAERVTSLVTEEDYYQLMSTYGIRRTDKQFWSHSDRVHKQHQLNAPIDYGLLDYNRLENR